MQGAKILSLSRRAKYLILHTDKGDIIVHLGMSGSLSILKVSDNLPAGKHDHVDLTTESGVILRYNDPRKFGCWLWAEKAEEHELLKKLGPEPLSDAFTSGYLFEKGRKKTVAIKNFIMNNEVVVGVGNYLRLWSLSLWRVFILNFPPKISRRNSVSAWLRSLKKYSLNRSFKAAPRLRILFNPMVSLVILLKCYRFMGVKAKNAMIAVRLLKRK